MSRSSTAESETQAGLTEGLTCLTTTSYTGEQKENTCNLPQTHTTANQCGWDSNPGKTPEF